MNENKEFKPYIPAEKVTAEMTVTSVIMGVSSLLSYLVLLTHTSDFVSV